MFLNSLLFTNLVIKFEFNFNTRNMKALLCIVEILFICYMMFYCIIMFKQNKELSKLKYKYEILEQINQLNMELNDRKMDHRYNCDYNKGQDIITNSYMEIQKVVSRLSSYLLIIEKLDK